MATQLKDLKFSDFAIKGIQGPNTDVHKYILGSTNDSMIYEYTVLSGGCETTTYAPLIEYDHGADSWRFHGTADRAATAASALALTNGGSSYTTIGTLDVPSFALGSSTTAEAIWISAFVTALGQNHIAIFSIDSHS